ncbi:putative serine/threonine protein kinase [Trichoderma virens Gv29-8]|uniref:non-specific serine/threonine protein kinase n=1 Tax=Hypocrea virens (strain Gv29-8 / FGSC 10586) TaxID=413071 RepID=G9N2H9_HYPVG|nr:putative serine/threonine protein kinase [Trichoderma virens Gv29-8]EHK19353.1 putative serine/threonine protein kinase [Trichoderma virens Gv29-8]
MSLIPYQPQEGREIVLCFGVDPESYVDPGYFRMLRAGNADSTATDQAPSGLIRRLFRPAPGGDSQGSRTSPAVDDDAEFISSTPGVPQPEGSRINREAFSPNYFKTFFVEEKVLGKGGKGVVLLVRHEIDGCQLGHFACKRVPVGDDHAWLEKVLIEVELLAKLSHANLVSYRHVWLEDVRLTMFGPSVACAFILQQYCNSGDLHQYVIGSVPREVTKEELKERIRRRSRGQIDANRDSLHDKPRLSVEEIYSLFKDITSGVAYLHGANYIHRDLKPSNCLLHREGGKLRCLISDFGEVQQENVVRKSTGTTGTISYCAPEVLRMDETGNYGNFTTKSDIFSLGMILYFMCFGRLPYQSANAVQEELEDVDQLRAEITDWTGFQDERRERPDLPSKLYMLLKKLLALDPAERPSANEVLNAMKSETYFDGITKDRGTSPAVGLRGNRVQSLDSPAAPSTPEPADLRRGYHSRSLSVPQSDAASWPATGSHDEDIMQDGSVFDQADPEPSNAIVKSRSQNGHHDHGQHTLQTAGQINLPIQTNGHARLDGPLLLTPPPQEASSMPRGAGLLLLRFCAAIGVTPDTVRYFGRLALFLIKLSTLVRPCWPYMASLEVGVPLVLLAVLDLGLPTSTSAAPARRLSHGELVTSLFRQTGLGTRLLFLVLHLAVVWLAGRWEALCVAVPRDEWDGW